jgi:DnaJ-class molecular chaperone
MVELRRSPYEVLGLAPGASAEDIKRAYRSQAQRHHPDRHPGDANAGARFQEIQAAYLALTRPAPQGQPQPFWAGSPEMWTVFADLFEASRAPPTRRRVEIVLDLADVLTPHVRTVQGPRGQVWSVALPAGVQHGDRFALFSPPHGGVEWEAVVRVRPHPTFRREGADLFSLLPLRYAQLVLGGPVDIEGLRSTLTVKIPKGLEPGQQVRLPGQGLPDGAGGRGDWYVEVRLAMPPKLTPTQVRTLRRWDKNVSTPAEA